MRKKIIKIIVATTILTTIVIVAIAIDDNIQTCSRGMLTTSLAYTWQHTFQIVN
jgi:hypothetical protein